MRGTNQEAAILKAREALNIKEAYSAKAWRVRRLDQLSETYYLVQFNNKKATIGVAAVNKNTGKVESYARLPGKAYHITVNAKQAIELVSKEKTAHAELVWKSCQASKSPLYPLWQVKTRRGVKYVDQNKKVWEKLEANTLGGAT